MNFADSYETQFPNHKHVISYAFKNQVVGRKFDGYSVFGWIGGGGMGDVYAARHLAMNRLEALKFIKQEYLEANDEKALARFKVEVRTAAKLVHSNIVLAYSAGEEDDICYLAMELLRGDNLDSLVKSRGPLPVQEAVDYTLQAATGLAYAHDDQDIVHRDIKPSNLFLDEDGTVKILDLGLAMFTSNDGESVSTRPQITTDNKVLGTPEYMAPEIAYPTSDPDQGVDIYSLGCTLFFLLIGRPPYERNTPMATIIAHRETEIPSLQSLRLEIPKAVEDVCHRMLQKKPEDRYQSMAEVIDALQMSVDELPETVLLNPTRGLLKSGNSISVRTKAAVVAVPAVVVAVLLAVTFGRVQSTPDGGQPSESISAGTSSVTGNGERKGTPSVLSGTIDVLI